MNKEKNALKICAIKRTAHYLLTALITLFLISGCKLVYADGIVRRLNIIPLIIFFILMLILIMLERKLEYFKYIRRCFIIIIERVFKLKEKKPLMVIRLLSYLITCVDLSLVFIFIFIGHYSRMSFICVFIITALAVLLQLADKSFIERDSAPSKLFLIIALLVGVCFCYTLPVYTGVSWDDQIHINNVFSASLFSKKNFSLADDNLVHHVYYRISESFTKEMDKPGIIIEQLLRDDTVFAEFKRASFNPYTAFAYIPMILISLISQIFDLDIVKTLTLFRIANLSVYIAVCYFGIKRLKSGQYIFSAICLLPATLFLACSFGYDFWIIAFMTYVSAYVISELQRPDKQFSAKDLLSVIIALVIGCGPKAIYCIMLLILLFLQKSKFTGSRQRWIFASITVFTIALVGSTILIGGAYSDFYTDIRGGEDVNSIEQIKYVLGHPFTYAKVLIMHFLQYFSFKNAASHLALYGNMGTPMLAFGYLTIGILLYTILTDRQKGERYKEMRVARIGGLFIGLLQATLISSALYASFTPVGSDIIEGCQYRYIFPYLPLVCFFLRPESLKHICINDRIQKTIVFGAVSVNLFVSYVLVHMIKIF